MQHPSQSGFRLGVATAVTCLLIAGSGRHASLQTLADEPIAINDNRQPAGSLRDGVLTVALVARQGLWRPDGNADPGVNIMAFGAEGRAMRFQDH